MNAPAASGRELIAFQGAVHWRTGPGAVSLMLDGRAAGAAAQVLFCGTETPALPPELRDVRIRQLSADDAAAAGMAHRWRLDAHGISLILQGRSAQVHPDTAAAFLAALPAPRAPARLRLAWFMLLTALRLPGAARIISRLRGSA